MAVPEGAAALARLRQDSTHTREDSIAPGKRQRPNPAAARRRAGSYRRGAVRTGRAGRRQTRPPRPPAAALRWLWVLLLGTGAVAPLLAREVPGAVPDAGFEQVVAAGDYRYARSRRAGVFVSLDGGRTWQPRNTGLPHRVVHPFPQPPEYRYITSLGVDPRNPRRVAATTAGGVYLSEDGGGSWQAIPLREPVRSLAYFTSVAPSPHHPDALLLGTSFHGVYETTDRGASWRHLSSTSRFLTQDTLYFEEVAAVSYDPAAPNAFAVLAGFDGGVYYHHQRRAPRDGEDADWWQRYPVPATATTHLSYVQDGAEWVLEAGTGPSRWWLTGAGTWAPAGTRELPASVASAAAPAKPPAASPRQVGQPAAPATTAGRPPRQLGPGIPAAPAAVADQADSEPVPAATRERTPEPRPRAVAAQRHGIYLSAWSAAARLPEFLRFLRRHGLNSFVVDLKADDGYLTYDSTLPLAHEMGAVQGLIEVDELVAQAHAAGMYVIGRLVVFKDPFLYRWQDHRLAVWDREQDAPWRHLVPVAPESATATTTGEGGAAGQTSGAVQEPATEQREFWVDPYAAEAWEYNVAVAAELAARGVDEIQFDYVRFPSDGPVERAGYRHRRPGMTRIDAIESFLALARERVRVPISTDLFGFNSWYRSGNWIGQNIDVLSEYVDVISPMFYPSHFPNDFLSDRSYLERAYAIYERGVRRARHLVQGRSYIRPYVQAFLIGGELRMEEEEYSRYLTRQLEGNRTAGGAGFTLWNASNRYYMVTEPLRPYLSEP